MRWIKGIGLIVAALLIWAAASGLFLSKARICNAILEKLATQKVGVCYDRRTLSALGCSLQNSRILYEHTPVAAIRTLSLAPRYIQAEGIELKGVAASLIPPRIEAVRFDLLRGRIEAHGDFGKLTGRIDYGERTVTLLLTPSALMRRDGRQLLSAFRYENGRYRYVIRF